MPGMPPLWGKLDAGADLSQRSSATLLLLHDYSYVVHVVCYVMLCYVMLCHIVVYYIVLYLYIHISLYIYIYIHMYLSLPLSL